MILFVQTGLNEANRTTLRQQIGDSHTLIFRNELSAIEQQAAFQQADVLMGNPPIAWLQIAPNLKFWQLDSAGFNNYSELNLTIPVANMGDYFAWPCAETIVAGILALYRRVDELVVLQRQQKWVGAPLRSTMTNLHNQRVVILGAGTIGQAVRSILTGFQCDIRLMARTNSEAQISSRDELLATLPNT
ncbi:MAG: D-2-hydroxyacid dehydrogenase, partial [Rudanella sp.]|nr:D-2-hydroxyacid dehydrogenase [Rudanella sp.]